MYSYTYRYAIDTGAFMESMTYTALREKLAETLDKVNEDNKPLLITRRNGKPAVLMSLSEFHSYEETAYLTASPKNAELLEQAMKDFKAGKFIEKDIFDE